MPADLFERISLNGTDWQLSGWVRHYWRMQKTMEIDSPTLPMIARVRASVPGSVHGALLQAGVIPDWNQALASYQSEWVNNREWIFEKELVIPAAWQGREITLCCAGLDYSGLVYLDATCVGEFEGTHVPHRFRLTAAARCGSRQKLSIVFHQSPQLDAQMGYTNRLEHLKPRFNYTWDWVGRVVNIGIWDDIALVATGRARFEHAFVSAHLDPDLTTGRIAVKATTPGADSAAFELSDGKRSVWQASVEVQDGHLATTFTVAPLKPWYPNGLGDQPLYTLTATLAGADGALSDRRQWTLGFRHVVWQPNEAAPAEAYPYLPVVNGQKVFLRGLNWVPLSPCFGDVGETQYLELLQAYKSMNVNLIRIWGGGILEKEACYRIADELGIFLWQEYPLSSSALSNTPPEDERTLAAMRRLAVDWVERRGFHPSHLLWDGGNEITYGSHLDRDMIPIDERHPMIAMFKEVVEEYDPGKHFLPSSPSGPTFFVKTENLGKGLHHDTHGHWGVMPSAPFYAGSNADDSLLRSEVGVSALAHLESLRKYANGMPILPLDVSNPYYLNHGGFFWKTEPVLQEFGLAQPQTDADLRQLVSLSHYLQAEQYRYLAESVRRRAFSASGILFWMGHDDFSCVMNNSFIELGTILKPAYWYLRSAFAPRHLSLRYGKITYAPDEPLAMRLFVHNDGEPFSASLAVRVRSLQGKILDEVELRRQVPTVGAQELYALNPPVGLTPERVFAVEVTLADGTTPLEKNTYLFTQASAAQPLAPLATLPTTTLAPTASGRAMHITNTGAIAALGVCLRTTPLSPGTPRGYEVIFPGESTSIPMAGIQGECSVDAMNLQR